MFATNLQKSKYKIDGKELTGVPGQDLKSNSFIRRLVLKLLPFAVFLKRLADLGILERVEVEYVMLPGWKSSIEQIRSYDCKTIARSTLNL